MPWEILTITSHLVPRSTSIRIVIHVESQNPLAWKGSLRSLRPTIKLTLLSLHPNYETPQPYITLIPCAHICEPEMSITGMRLVHSANITLFSHHLRKGNSCWKPTLPVWKGYGISWSHFFCWLWLLESYSKLISRERFSPTIQQFFAYFYPSNWLLYQFSSANISLHHT